MPFFDSALNSEVDDIVSSDLTVYAHTAAPGALGTTGRISASTGTLSAANWTNAASGDVVYSPITTVGVLNAGAATRVTYISVWNGATPLFYAAVAPAVNVTAGAAFQVAANTIRINGSTT